MSRRLRRYILELRMARGRPADSTRVIRSDHHEKLRGALRRACKDAGIAPHNPKDMRDTFATTLLVQGGFNLKYIARQLGHASVRTTEQHYARWVDDDDYRNPWHVPEGCLPTDLFAELDRWIPGRATTMPLRATKRAST